MNKYSFKFKATCPNDNKNIDYFLVIKTEKMIYVEELVDHIKKHCSEGFHENIADDLYCLFGGNQKLTATHQGVLIETFRNDE